MRCVTALSEIYGRFLRPPVRRGQRYDLKGFLGSIRETFFKISLDTTHLDGDMRKAKHCAIAGLGEGVERRRLHLDRKNAGVLCSVDRLLRFPEWSVRGPCRARLDRNARCGQCFSCHLR